jgi:hypothetical protein
MEKAQRGTQEEGEGSDEYNPEPAKIYKLVTLSRL